MRVLNITPFDPFQNGNSPSPGAELEKCPLAKATGQMNDFSYGSVMALYLKLPEAIDQHSLNHRRWDELLESGEMGLYETQRV